MKLFFILFSLVIPVLGFAQKNVVVATFADPGHLNPGITTGYNVHVFADSIYSGLVMLDRSHYNHHQTWQSRGKLRTTPKLTVSFSEKMPDGMMGSPSHLRM